MRNTRIAGHRTVSQWIALRDKLKSNPSEKLWGQAFDDFLFSRVKTRYYDPIEAISKIPVQYGKGFSIITIYCSLIEFFETLLKGYYFEKQNYKNGSGNIVKSKTRKDKKGNAHSLSTEEVFVQFLTENEPFKSYFNDALAIGFYKNVRCSILHQAETTGDWIIKEGKESDSIVHKSTTETIVRWKPFKKSFDAFLESYGRSLKTEQIRQKNFVLKWNKISNLLENTTNVKPFVSH